MSANQLHDLAAEADALVAEFGDDDLRARNQKFDRQFTIAERKASVRVRLLVTALVAVALGLALMIGAAP